MSISERLGGVQLLSRGRILGQIIRRFWFAIVRFWIRMGFRRSFVAWIARCLARFALSSEEWQLRFGALASFPFGRIVDKGHIVGIGAPRNAKGT